MNIIIDKEFENKTIKELLFNILKFSRATVISLKNKDDGIVVNGERVTVRYRLCPGDELSLNLSDGEEDVNEDIVMNNLPFEIIYEDEDIIAVVKERGMPTHPSHNHYDDTLANALCYYYNSIGRVFVCRFINRLDAQTGGIVLAAKNKAAAAAMSFLMKNRGFEKKYIAVLGGRIEKESDDIETYIRRREESIIIREACKLREDAKIAITHYDTIKATDEYSIVYAYPKTGRTHQLRVHFDYVGHSIIGDTLYNGMANDKLMLFACELSFPYKGKNLTLRAKLPPDFEALL